MNIEALSQARRKCAIKLLNLYKKANAGHIGTSLSCLEILVYLCFHRMAADDVLILSKGHGAAALYSTLSLSGRMPDVDLDTFYEEGTLLAAHPPCNRRIPAIPFGTGSLGHGLSLAAGLAFSQRFTGRKFRVYAVLSDGDCNEGSTWEAALFAAHHKLTQLTVIIDLNGLQGFGATHDILDLHPICDKWKSFGFSVTHCLNGNDLASLNLAFENTEPEGRPTCIVASTTKGHGISYMEDKLEWHYLPMNEDQYLSALSEVENT